jgi:molybdopterin-containing oxidoreductase family iron-sulfur binding subunit
MPSMNNKENITPTGAQSVTAQGKKFWRSLDELASTDEFNDWLHREFPRQASEWLDSLSRRKFLKVMGASLAFAGLTSCIEMAPEKIVPYVQEPEVIVPG